jgi:hypothetical protein
MTTYSVNPAVRDLGELGHCHSVSGTGDGQSRISFVPGEYDHDTFIASLSPGDELIVVNENPYRWDEDNVRPVYLSVLKYDPTGALISDLTAEWNAEQDEGDAEDGAVVDDSPSIELPEGMWLVSYPE